MMKPISERSCAELKQALKHIDELKKFVQEMSTGSIEWNKVLELLDDNRNQLEKEIKKRC